MNVVQLSKPVSQILDAFECGQEVSQTDAEILFAAKGADLAAIIKLANR